MGCRYRVELDAPGYEAQVQEGEFSDEEAALLRTYLDQYEAVAASPTLNSGLPCSIRLKWQGQQAAIETELPDADTLGLLLHRMRPFILQNEPASFLVVSSLIGRKVELQPIRDMLGRLRRDFDGRSFRETIQIDVNDIMLNSDRTLTDWLNSHEYHRDPEKRETVQELLDALPGELARGVFVSMVIDKMRACANLAKLVAVLLNRQSQLKFDGSGSETFTELAGSDSQGPQPDMRCQR